MFFEEMPGDDMGGATSTPPAGDENSGEEAGTGGEQQM